MPANRLRTLSALVLAATLVPGCVHGARTDLQRTAATAPAAARRVSLGDYIALLPPPPIVVGFDVDDTALFSTPAFLYALGRLMPEPPAPRGTAADEVKDWREWARTLETRRQVLFGRVIAGGPDLTPWERAQRLQFWEDVNSSGDAFSPPKATVRALVEQHLRRGDEVVFITARPKTSSEHLTTKLRADFGSDRVRVEFTGQQPKSALMRDAKVAIYYGDADGDMDDAAAAGARAVRILRSAYSSNRGQTAVGLRGEWVVIQDSEL